MRRLRNGFLLGFALAAALAVSGGAGATPDTRFAAERFDLTTRTGVDKYLASICRPRRADRPARGKELRRCALPGEALELHEGAQSHPTLEEHDGWEPIRVLGVDNRNSAGWLSAFGIPASNE